MRHRFLLFMKMKIYSSLINHREWPRSLHFIILQVRLQTGCTDIMKNIRSHIPFMSLRGLTGLHQRCCCSQNTVTAIPFVPLLNRRGKSDVNIKQSQKDSYRKMKGAFVYQSAEKKDRSLN